MSNRRPAHRSFVSRPLSFERLQQRSMLAGNVSAFVDRGTLIVNGDIGDNELRITQVGKDMIQLESMSSPTTINNRTGVAVFKVTKGYNFNMGGGNDVLQFDGVNIRSKNDLVVDMGVGDDNLQFNNVNVLRIRAILGEGHDSATVTNSKVERSLNVFGAGGDDQLTLANSKFGEKSVIDGNDGANFLNQSNVKFGRKLQSLNWTFGTRPPITPPDVNDAPVGVNDAGATTEGSSTSTTGNVLTNDTDSDSASKIVSAVKGVAANVAIDVAGDHGTFRINQDGSYTYTLNNADAAVNALAAGATLTDTIAYTVSDGILTDTAELTITITGVNDAPTGTDKTITTTEDTAYTFTAADFGFGDANDTPANALTGVKITTLPAAGSLALNGVAVTANQVVSLADITGGLLKWTPASNANGNANTTFTFQVQDNGGTANGGIDLDASANTITFNVTAVNDAPTGADKTITTTEDTAYTFTAADFGFGDANDTPANALTGVKITTLPAAGILTLNGVAVTVDQIISLANVNSGLLIWTPASNVNGNAITTFTFQVQDDGGTTNGGIDLDPSANTITFNVTPLNDAPTGTDKTITTNEDTPYVLTAADFGFGDANDTPANALSTVKITTIPGAGSLKLNGVDVTVNQIVSLANINSGLLIWTPASNANGNAIATFTFQVQDDGGTANGGIDLDASANTITFDVTPVNDAPVGVADAAEATEDSGAPAVGNVLTNDTDPDGPTKNVTEVDGLPAAVGTDVPGDFGTFHINADGSFTYLINDANATVNALNDGQTLVDVVSYTVSDGTLTSTVNLTVTIQGHTDP